MQENDEIITFCQNVRAIRLREGLSACEMAKALGISTGALEELEGGNLSDEVCIDVLFRIHSRFGILPRDHF